MKERFTSSKILTLVIVLMTVFLCLINVTYSYFSAKDNVAGNVNLSQILLEGVYWETEYGDTVLGLGGTEVPMFPATNKINRGSHFKLKKNVDDESSMGAIGYRVTGTTVFVRFWIDAYIVDENGVENKTTNYGEYFLAGDVDGDEFVEVYGDYTKSNDSNTYFVNESVEGDSGDNYAFSALKLVDNAPDDMLGEKLRIYVTFDACQSSNKAFKSVFDDEHGYLESWESYQ